MERWISMGLLKGITIKLYEKVKVGEDPFGAPIYQEIPVEIENVLVAPESSQEIISAQDLQGARADYVLGIPKGDVHEWRNRKVEFFGQTFKTIGVPVMGIDDMIPLDWNAKVKVKRVE